MPRKPTAIAREARRRILERIAQLKEGEMLPTTRELGEAYDLHPSTIFRLLRDLAAEGLVWQSPGGRYYAADTQSCVLRGVPLCFIGREMWQWSRLYQELLEGVAEVCSANESPLMFISSPYLVRQSSALDEVCFLDVGDQLAEMRRIVTSLPRGCAGYLFDHQWDPGVIEAVGLGGQRAVQLLHGDVRVSAVAGIDLEAGARLVSGRLEQQAKSVWLVQPFEGDVVMNAMAAYLKAGLNAHAVRIVPFVEVLKRVDSGELEARQVCLICPEDNMALELRHRIDASAVKHRIQLIATQGTGLVTAPTVRLRYDYRRLGRSAAARILHGTAAIPIQPAWVQSE